MGMRLVPFLPAHGPLVATWATTSVDLDQWASLDRAPTEETFATWLAEPGAHAHLLMDDVPLAYGELWVSEQVDEVELARLLVAPGLRNRGVGRTLVQLLVDASRAFPISTAWVRVVPANVAALRCYAAAGFSRVPPRVESQLNAIQPRPYRWLSLEL